MITAKKRDKCLSHAQQALASIEAIYEVLGWDENEVFWVEIAKAKVAINEVISVFLAASVQESTER